MHLPQTYPFQRLVLKYLKGDNMAIYGIVENDTIINCIIADSQEIAEQIANGKEVVLSENGKPSRGNIRINGVWTTESPYSSWIFDGQQWVAPTPPPAEYPQFYVWDEETLSWVPDPLQKDILEEILNNTV